MSRTDTTGHAPDVARPDAVRAALARLEAAALRLRAVLGAPTAAGARPGGGPTGTAAWRAALDEELCDRLVDLAAARAWAGRQQASTSGAPGPADAVLRGCALWAVDADTARVLALAGADAGPANAVGVVAAHGRVAELVTALAAADVYDAVRDRLRATLGPCPAGRAAAAWQIADTALAGLATTRDEWVGADPAHTAAGCWVLVDRVGRLALAAALLTAAPGETPETAAPRVNAARRHTWNHLRQPPPEAATPTHVRRTAELVDWIAGSAERSRT